MNGTELQLDTDDGRQLAATWYAADGQAKGSILFLSALAVPETGYRHIAAWLAGSGWNVLTFDYGGTAASASSPASRADRRMSADHWTQHDLPAAFDAVKAKAPDDPVMVMTHSVGGQLLGQSPIAAKIDGAIFIASQRGIPKFYEGATKRWLQLGLVVIPLLNATIGHIPPMKGGLPEALPGPAANQWATWCRKGRFTNLQGDDIEPRFSNMAAPLVAIDIADDPMAPAAAVDALGAVYKAAQVTRVTLDPASLGLDAIGHFGWMRPKVGETVWPEMERHLRNMAQSRRQGVQASVASQS